MEWMLHTQMVLTLTWHVWSVAGTDGWLPAHQPCPWKGRPKRGGGSVDVCWELICKAVGKLDV